MNQHTITITNIPTFLYSRFFFNVIMMMIMAVLLYILEKKTHTHVQSRALTVVVVMRTGFFSFVV